MKKLPLEIVILRLRLFGDALKQDPRTAYMSCFHDDHVETMTACDDYVARTSGFASRVEMMTAIAVALGARLEVRIPPQPG